MHDPEMHFMYGTLLPYMPHFKGIFVSSTYFAITCKVKVVVSWYLAYIFKNGGPVCWFRIWPCELYFECGSHIFSVMYVKDMYSAPCWMVGTTAFTHVVYTYIPYICMLGIWHPWHICQFWWAHLFLTCIWQITSVIKVIVYCILVYICKNVRSICPWNMLSIWVVFQMWQSYLFSDICQIIVQCSLLNSWCQWLNIWHKYVHIPHTCISNIWHIFWVITLM